MVEQNDPAQAIPDDRPPLTQAAYAGRIREFLEKARVANQVHLAHLARNGREDPLATRVQPMLEAIEKVIEDDIVARTSAHPVWQNWGRYVRGLGPMSVGAVMSRVDITRCDTVSSLWAHAGFRPGQRRVKGQKVDYDQTCKVWCWRVADSLIKHPGKFKDLYDRRKVYEYERIINAGGRVVPAKKGQERRADDAPYSQDMTILQVHQRAMRYMVKIWLACLWQIWRETEGLSTEPPYIIGRTDADGHVHTQVWKPSDFMDREPVKP